MTYKNVTASMLRHATAPPGATGQNAMVIVNRPEYAMQIIRLKKLKIETVLSFVFSMWKMRLMKILKHVQFTIIEQNEIEIRDY